MKIVKLPKENLKKFIALLGILVEIYAPVKRNDESFSFALVTIVWCNRGKLACNIPV